LLQVGRAELQLAPAGGPTGLPSKNTLEYLKLAIELLLLLLAVPWLIREMARNPGRLSRQAANKHLKG
jgi:hypothetical protein